MPNKKLITLIIVLVILGGGLYLYKTNKPSDSNVNQNNGLNCILQRTGKVAMKMYYPDEFNLSENLANNGSVSFYKDNTSSLILYIDWQSGYSSLEALLNKDRIESGPVYELSNFNGHEAVFYENDESEEGLWQYYRVSYVNRVIEVGYNFSTLNDVEKKLAEEMLDSIELLEVEEDISTKIVEPCK